jgi:hypothetical protein
MARVRLGVYLVVGTICLIPLLLLAAIVGAGVPVAVAVSGWEAFTDNPAPFLIAGGVLSIYALLLTR